MEATLGPLSEEVIGELVDSEAAFFLLRMHEGTPIKSHIVEFSFIINDLDKIDVRIEDEHQALLLLCYLLSSYKSFREAIIYRGKLTIKINEVNEHLLKKDKLDNQLKGESHRNDSEEAHFTKEE